MTTSVATCRPPAAPPKWYGAAAMQRSRQAALAQAPEQAKQAPAAHESLKKRSGSEASSHQSNHNARKATSTQGTMAQCPRYKPRLLPASEGSAVDLPADAVWADGRRPGERREQSDYGSRERVVGRERTGHLRPNGIYHGSCG